MNRFIAGALFLYGCGQVSDTATFADDKGGKIQAGSDGASSAEARFEIPAGDATSEQLGIAMWVMTQPDGGERGTVEGLDKSGGQIASFVVVGGPDGLTLTSAAGGALNVDEGGTVLKTTLDETDMDQLGAFASDYEVAPSDLLTGPRCYVLYAGVLALAALCGSGNPGACVGFAINYCQWSFECGGLNWCNY